MILTVGNYIFPLITYPYVSRVLGVSNIGVCNYVDSIVNYFVLFASLGIAIVGIREIARNKENPEMLQRVFASLFMTNLLLAVVACGVLLLCTFCIGEFAAYKEFYFIGIVKLLLSAFAVEWLFQGLSDFKFITVRSLIVRGLYVVSVFVFVHEQADAFIYYFLSCLMAIATSVWNWKYSLKFVSYRFRNISLLAYAAPILSFGFYKILASMYTYFNVAYLGWTTDTTQVGYYTTATKLYTIFLSVFTAFTAVMMPRINELVGKGDTERLRYIANQTFELVFIFSLPILIACFFYAPQIVDIISGKGYEGAVLPFRIVMVLLVVVALEQIIICQFLMAVTKSNCVTILSAIGAVIGVSLNILLTPHYLAVGTSISWVASETGILLCSTYYFRKYYSMNFPWAKLMANLLCSIPYIIIGVLTMNTTLPVIATGAALMTAWFAVLNLRVRRNELLGELVAKCASKFKGK